MQRQNSLHDLYQENSAEECRKELGFFLVDGKYYGGDQNWHSHMMMNRGGCSAVTACETCIYLAKSNSRLRALYPYDPQNVTKQDFLRFFELMFRYVYPGIGGLTSIKKFSRMLGKYIATTGVDVDIACLAGNEPYTKAGQFVKEAIDAQLPVMYLLLLHSDKKYNEFEWHWFTLTGYEQSACGLQVDFATWGKKHRFALPEMWKTNKIQRGGMVCIKP